MLLSCQAGAFLTHLCLNEPLFYNRCWHFALQTLAYGQICSLFQATLSILQACPWLCGHLTSLLTCSQRQSCSNWSRTDSQGNTTISAAVETLYTLAKVLRNSDAGLVQGQSALVGFLDTSWIQLSSTTSLTQLWAHLAWLPGTWVWVHLLQLNIQSMGDPCDC